MFYDHKKYEMVLGHKYEMFLDHYEYGRQIEASLRYKYDRQVQTEITQKLGF